MILSTKETVSIPKIKERLLQEEMQGEGPAPGRHLPREEDKIEAPGDRP